MLKKYLQTLVVFSLAVFITIRPARAQQLSEQIVTDLVTVGITGVATLSGNIPLAMASGVLSKYISTYGVQGVKFLINKVKAEPPKDLGEVNIYFIYLIHVKRNLYQSLINIRANVKGEDFRGTLIKEIEAVEASMRGNCSGSCRITGFDESLIDQEFLNFSLEAKQSFNIFDYLNERQVRTTYQYLMLLYMDVILIEQKLLETQYNVIALQVSELLKNLEDNLYLSNEEKEHTFLVAMNIVLKWQKQRDQRRALLLTSLQNPMRDLQRENSQLEDEINGYRDLNDELKKLPMGY